MNVPTRPHSNNARDPAGRSQRQQNYDSSATITSIAATITSIDRDQYMTENLSKETILRLPWKPKKRLAVIELIRRRGKAKTQFFVTLACFMLFWILSIPSMVYVIKHLVQTDRAMQICAILGSMDAFAFIVILGMGLYYKHVDHEIQMEVIHIMKDNGIIDPNHYVAMHVLEGRDDGLPPVI